MHSAQSIKLHNIRIVCPAVATFAINTYRASARLFVTGGKELVSAEGTTQGDHLALGLYASVYSRLSLVYKQLVKPNNAGL